MRAALPGTRHSQLLSREEVPIFTRIKSTTCIQKLKAEWFYHTGSRRKQLVIQPSNITGTYGLMVEGFLFIGSGKCKLRIYAAAGTTIEELGEEIRQLLAKYRIPVKLSQKNGDIYKEAH